MTLINKWSSCFQDSNSTVQFNPATNISQCYAHWKSDTGITLSGSNSITAWTDVVNGRVLASSGSLTPYYSASNPNVNGRPSILFNGTTKLISNQPASNWGFLHSVKLTGSAVVFCLKHETATLQTVYATSNVNIGSANPGKAFVIRYVSDINTTLLGNAGSGTRVLSTTPTYASGSVIYMCDSLSGSNVYKKGTGLPYTVTANTLPDSADTSATVPFMLGSLDGSGWGDLRSHIMEVIVYNKNLSEAEMAQLGNYFTQKYGAQP